jgi:phage major head subunit gpT-like protein
MLVQSQFDSLLLPTIYHHFDLGRTQVPSLRSQLFTIRTSGLSSERGTGMGGISPDAWDVYKQSGNKGQLEFDQLYTQVYTHVEYPVQLRIEKRLLMNDQYGFLQTLVQRAGLSAEIKQEIDAASLLNNAFSGVLWSDGKALCATDHPRSRHKSAGTFSNKGTSALSKASVAETRIAMMRFKDDKGNELGLMPNELWVPPELEDTALEITRSVLDPSSGNNAINPQAARFRVIPWARLSDTNNWFMVDGTWRRQVVNWYERESLQVMVVDESTTDYTVEMKLHYSFGVDDWRWIYGHEVTGS